MGSSRPFVIIKRSFLSSLENVINKNQMVCNMFAAQ